MSQDFPALQNDRILRAARGEATDKVPVWIHRQAGRYLPEFREERLKADFFTICRTPELACKITLQPLDRFPLDAAIIFSDILVIPQALGMEVLMVKGKGPVLPEPLVVPDDLKKLHTFETADVKNSLAYVYEAISMTRHALKGKVPLIGFAGAPWTLMAYMVQGQGAKTYSKAKGWLYKYPEASHQLLQLLTDVIIEYLIQQVIGGAQLLEVFDSWAGDLTPDMFMEFCLPYLTKIVVGVKKGLAERGAEVVPMTVFPRTVHHEGLEALAKSGYDVVSLDWSITPSSARARLDAAVSAADSKVASISLQGNLDSSIFYASEETIRSETRKMIDSFGSQKYIANLGHGMLPDHPPSAVEIFVDEIHSYSASLNAQL